MNGGNDDGTQALGMESGQEDRVQDAALHG
jgi:hypothetical protein